MSRAAASPFAPCLACLILGVSFFVAPRAAAVDPAEVEELIRMGVDLRRAGRDPAALPYFRRAYDLERSPRTAAQLGLVEAAIGYWPAAEQHLVEAMNAGNHPWLAQHMNEIRATLERVRAYICELDVVGGPVGAEVIVNGRTVGRLPLAEPVRVAEGTVQVTVRTPGYIEATSSIAVKGGGSERVDVALVPASGYVPGAVDPTRPSIGVAPTQRHPAHATPPLHLGLDGLDEAPPARWIRPTAWVAATAAIAAGGLGGYQVLEQRKHQRSFNNYRPPGTIDRPCAVLAIRRGGPPCDAIYKDARLASRLAIIGFAGAGVLATTALVAFVASSGGTRYAAADGAGSPLVLLAPETVSLGWSLGF